MSCSIEESPATTTTTSSSLDKSSLSIVSSSSQSTLTTLTPINTNTSTSNNTNSTNNILSTITNQTSLINNTNGVTLNTSNSESENAATTNTTTLANNTTATATSSSSLNTTAINSTPTKIASQISLSSVNLSSSNSPTKIVQAGSQFIITTLFQGGSTQKVVTVATPTSVNSTSSQQQQPPASISIINSNTNTNNSSSASSSTSASSSSSSSSGSSSPNDNSASKIPTPPPQQQQQSQPQTTTITLTSPPLNHINSSTAPPSSSTSASASSTAGLNIFPLQDVHPQQQFAYIDTNGSNGGQNGSLFSPLGGNSITTSNGQYYTYQSTPNYANNQQAQLLINTNQSQQTQNQQQQQPQQQIYMMYQEPSSLDNDDGSREFEGHVAHTAQAAPITVQWLIDNFEPAEGCSLRRSTLYNYYLHHCTEQHLEPVNPASFGKLIRSVFLGLRTRRLGTRGNSKYHYYGIRVKALSPLNQLAEDHAIAIRNHPLSLSPTGSPQPHQQQQQTPQSPQIMHNQNIQNQNNGHGPSVKRLKSSISSYDSANSDFKPVVSNEIHNSNNQSQIILQNSSNNNNLLQQTTNKIVPTTTTIAKVISKNENKQMNNHSLHSNDLNNGLKQQQQTITPVASNSNENKQIGRANTNQMLDIAADEAAKAASALNSSGSAENPIANFGTINPDNVKLPANISKEDVKKFEELYKIHCEKILENVVALKFNNLEEIWLSFWRVSSVNYSFYEEQLPSTKFFILCEMNEIIEFVKQFDYQFYQFCIEILIPDVLGSLPPNLVQNIRTLAKNVDNWLRNALRNAPERIKQTKTLIINTFSMTLRRYTSLNHLAQTVRNSLQNQAILVQMLNDISKVDFAYIKEQAKWACDCDEAIIGKFEKEFKDSLRNHSTWNLDNWMTWLDSSANYYLQKFEGTDNYGKMAKKFLLKWSFLCSSVIRDLTLRSAPSFGSFHLIRLLYDEYMCFTIEHKIASESKLTPLAVMSTFDLGTTSSML